MSRKIFFSLWYFRCFSLLVLCTLLVIACADDQDATSARGDSAANSSDTTPAQKSGVAPTRHQEPRDLPDNAVTRLALREADANVYRHGTQFITRLPNNIDAAELENRQYGRWYTITSLPRPFNARNKDRLTNNVYGYLIYHDMVVRYPTGPHTVFLQWFGSGANVDSVVVWLNPPPTISRDTTATLDFSDPPRPKVPPPPPME